VCIRPPSVALACPPRPPPHPIPKTAARPSPPAPRAGWRLNYATGELGVDPSKRSALGAEFARGGAVNGPARGALARFGVPVMAGYGYSLALHGGHVMRRGVAGLDCLHYCSLGLNEVLVYELWRQLRAGIAGVKPLRGVPDDARQACAAAPTWY
jgi:hypothetical protein